MNRLASVLLEHPCINTRTEDLISFKSENGTARSKYIQSLIQWSVAENVGTRWRRGLGRFNYI